MDANELLLRVARAAAIYVLMLIVIRARVLFSYSVLLALVRMSGKTMVKQGSVFDVCIALTMGDIVDDLIWAEVPASQFVVAAGVLFLLHAAFEVLQYRREVFD